MFHLESYLVVIWDGWDYNLLVQIIPSFGCEFDVCIIGLSSCMFPLLVNLVFVVEPSTTRPKREYRNLVES